MFIIYSDDDFFLVVTSFWRTNPNQSGLDAMHEKSSLLG
jgi:hypothetical protein